MANKIDIRQWINKHPLKVGHPTDFSYLKVANDLLRIIRLSDWSKNMEEDDRCGLALDLTLYFEDVVSEIGLWKSFITKHKKLYNKYLPFYHIDEENYYIDEVNEEDIRFLIWSHGMETEFGIFLNPENSALLELTENVYAYLDEQFENIPINTTLKNLLFNEKKLCDFYYVKNILFWLIKRSYLVSSYITDAFLEECSDCYAQSIEERDKAEYMAVSLVAINDKVGPLAIKATEWFAMMCREAGLEDFATDISNIHSCKCKAFQIENYDNECLYTKGADGANYKLDRSVFLCLDENTLQTRGFFFSDLVNYRGEWNVNGFTSWSENEKTFKNEENRLKEIEQRANVNIYNKMLEANGGHPMFYFKTGKEMKNYLQDYFTGCKKISLPKDYESWSDVAMFVDKNSELSICIDRVCCIKDKRNPFYDAHIADDEALNLLTNSDITSREMIHFLLENNLLPDARINSIYGKERGRQLVQENIDFITRYMYRNRY